MLKGPRPSPLLAPSIAPPLVQEEPRSKVPLRQIASFVERLQKQNGQAESELDRTKSRNKELETKVLDLEAKIHELEAVNQSKRSIEAQLKESLFSSEQFFELSKERDQLLAQIDSLHNESNFLPILQHELKCVEDEKRAIKEELEVVRQEATVYRTRISNIEDSNIAVEVKLDAQMREIAKMTRDNRSLIKENQDLLQSLKKVSETKKSEMAPQDIEDWIRAAKTNGLADRVPTLVQLDKLKRENRILLTEKIKLESEAWGLSPNKDIDDKITQFQLKAQELQKSVDASQLEIAQKNETIDNLMIERNELREIKSSLDAQVYNKSACIEGAKERLAKLLKMVNSNVDALPLHSKSPTLHTAGCQTDFKENPKFMMDTEESYLEKISELEAEVRALSLYVTKIVSRVASNQQLQSALFFGQSAPLSVTSEDGGNDKIKKRSHHPALQPAHQGDSLTDQEDLGYPNAVTKEGILDSKRFII